MADSEVRNRRKAAAAALLETGELPAQPAAPGINIKRAPVAGAFASANERVARAARLTRGVHGAGSDTAAGEFCLRCGEAGHSSAKCTAIFVPAGYDERKLFGEPGGEAAMMPLIPSALSELWTAQLGCLLAIVWADPLEVGERLLPGMASGSSAGWWAVFGALSAPYLLFALIFLQPASYRTACSCVGDVRGTFALLCAGARALQLAVVLGWWCVSVEGGARHSAPGLHARNVSCGAHLMNETQPRVAMFAVGFWMSVIAYFRMGGAQACADMWGLTTNPRMVRLSERFLLFSCSSSASSFLVAHRLISAGDGRHAVQLAAAPDALHRDHRGLGAGPRAADRSRRAGGAAGADILGVDAGDRDRLSGGER